MRFWTMTMAGATALLSVAVANDAGAKTASEIDAMAEQALKRCYAEVAGCKAAAAKASALLAFPDVTKVAVGVGGAYGEGALMEGGRVVGYYSTTSGSLGLQLGAASRSEIIMFMTPKALQEFRASSGWEVGGNANVVTIDQGKAADIDTVTAQQPVVAFIFGEKGLIGDLSLDGAKIAKIQPQP